MSEDTIGRPMRLSIEARERRGDGEISDAAMYYTVAAYGWFERLRTLPDESQQEVSETHRLPKFLAWGVTDLLAAALCYRIVDAPERARNRCRQGLLVVSDVQEYEPHFTRSENTARRGLASEMMGDLKIFGAFNDYGDHYEQAEEIYAEVDSHHGWQAEEEFESLTRPVFELADSTNHRIDPEISDKIARTSLVERVRFKRSMYDQLLDEVLNDGNWASENF